MLHASPRLLVEHILTLVGACFTLIGHFVGASSWLKSHQLRGRRANHTRPTRVKICSASYRGDAPNIVWRCWNTYRTTFDICPKVQICKNTAPGRCVQHLWALFRAMEIPCRPRSAACPRPYPFVAPVHASEIQKTGVSQNPEHSDIRLLRRDF